MKGRLAALAVATVAVVAACGSAGAPAGAPTTPSSPTTTPAVAPTPPPTTSVVPAPAGAPAPLPVLDTPAPSWRFPPGTPVDQSRVDALQAALGGPIVAVAADATHPWTFTGPGKPFDADAVWRATGADPKTLQVTTDGATTTARAPLGDGYSPLTTVVVTGAGQRVVSASGYLADPVVGPELPRVGTAAAAERLAASAGQAGLAPASPGAPAPSLAPQPPIAANPSIPLPGPCTKSDATACTPPAETAVPSPASPASVPTGVAPDLVAFPAADGGERLLPAYAFSLVGGGTRTVPAVDAGVLFIGLTEAQAAAEAARQGWAFRVVARDGHDLLVTQDYSPARVSASVNGGTVDKATFG